MIAPNEASHASLSRSRRRRSRTASATKRLRLRGPATRSTSRTSSSGRMRFVRRPMRTAWRTADGGSMPDVGADRRLGGPTSRSATPTTPAVCAAATSLDSLPDSQGAGTRRRQGRPRPADPTQAVLARPCASSSVGGAWPREARSARRVPSPCANGSTSHGRRSRPTPRPARSSPSGRGDLPARLGPAGPPSSRGLGRHPFKVEITGSNPVGGTNPSAAPGRSPDAKRPRPAGPAGQEM